jgi:hypothetical protein
VFEAISTFLWALSSVAKGFRKNGEIKIKKPRNRNREIEESVPVAKKKKPKTEDLSSSPGFWHLVKTRKPKPGAYIYKGNLSQPSKIKNSLSFFFFFFRKFTF